MHYILNSEAVLSDVIIKKLINNHITEIARMNQLERYYLNNHTINNRVFEDKLKPNNRVNHDYASYISDTLTGYFLGEPVTYNCENKETLEIIQNTFNYNDEQDENSELGKMMSIFGVAYEMIYVDIDGQVRFKCIDPREIIEIYDDTIENELLYTIRHYEVDDITKENSTYSIVEVYSRNSIKTYKTSNLADSLAFISEVEHYFNLVPIVEFKNNEYMRSDFESVITLIDAYDKLVSDGINDSEYFTDAYLCWGDYIPDKEDREQFNDMRNQRNIFGATPSFLTKDLTSNDAQTKLDRLDKDIYRFSKVVNMNDESFGNNASGVSLRSKLQSTENIVSMKERKFKKGLQRRIELISNVSSLFDNNFDYRSIEIIFTRNLPSNLVEIADSVSKLVGVVSQETILAQLPFIDDVNKELERIDNENEKKSESNAFYNFDMNDMSEVGSENGSDVIE